MRGRMGHPCETPSQSSPRTATEEGLAAAIIHCLGFAQRRSQEAARRLGGGGGQGRREREKVILLNQRQNIRSSSSCLSFLLIHTYVFHFLLRRQIQNGEPSQKKKKTESQHIGDTWSYQCVLFLPTIRIGEDNVFSSALLRRDGLVATQLLTNCITKLNGENS